MRPWRTHIDDVASIRRDTSPGRERIGAVAIHLWEGAIMGEERKHEGEEGLNAVNGCEVVCAVRGEAGGVRER